MDTNPVNQQKGPNFRAIIIDKNALLMVIVLKFEKLRL